METRARYLLLGVFTLVIVVAGFLFIYWLNNIGGVGERVTYRVRFDAVVPGLRDGSPVLFNGVRVGEVTGLRIDRQKPKQVDVMIAVDQNTPIASDTQAGVEMQGLMGSPAITLAGGSDGAAPLTATDGPPTLIASSGAAQDAIQAARDVLRHIDSVVMDNADPLKSTIADIKVFAAALARNSERIDTVMTGLSNTFAAQNKPPATVFTLAVPEEITGPATMPTGQLAVPEPTTVLALDTQKILVQSNGGVAPAYPDAQWADNLPKLIQAKVVQGFENAKFMGVSKNPDDFTADHQLVIDLRTFEVSTAADPQVMLEFSAKVMADGKVVAARVFKAAAPTKTDNAATVAKSFDTAFRGVVSDLVSWTLGVL
ncbi:ABC-type transport auxiliary lipoprotein family protein [Flaviflagellibacter deserti]|uniref:ABC-type transport auxiliary lipoprotein family protein n=1 Tax=Flaviflagellibacter deserti TaxID=2267266 RepID=A0ABV9Z1P3_9HYPH